MASDEIAHDFPGFFKVYKDGRVERYWDTDHTPAGLDPETGVESKDVLISPETGVKARIFLPKIPADKKLPVLLHYHGGGFCIGSPFATPFKIFLSTLATQAHVIAISVDYRLAPEHKLPIAYDDCWAGLQWLGLHAGGNGPEAWLNEHADLGNVVLAGESAGGNLAHYVAVQAGVRGVASGMNLTRMLLVHPYFGAGEVDRFYQYMCPTSSGARDDPKVHPAGDRNLGKMKVGRILVCVAEKDMLKVGGVSYVETMKKSDWEGTVDLYESGGEDHCFHFFNPKSESIAPLIKAVVDFLKQGN